MARWGAPVVAILAAAACLSLAVGHPLASVSLAVVLCCVTMGWAAWRPWTIGCLLATLLPVASLAPSTGWWLIDEFDLVVLAVLAGAYARMSFDAWRGGAADAAAVRDRVGFGLWMALGVSSTLSLVIGLLDAGAGTGAQPDLWTRALYGGYASVFNPVRVSKSLLWALLLLPVLQHLPESRRKFMVASTVQGLAFGLAMVCALVLWERWRYVGIFNFTDSYRTVAGFWEMHVGGGAIDAYLAMAVPVAFWAVWWVPAGWRWSGAALLALLSTYAVLTTYSRGLYLAVAISIVFMLIVARVCRIQPAAGSRVRGWSLKGLSLVLVAQAVWVLGGHTFMAGRVARVDADLLDRAAHWRDGLGLLKTPTDWMFGLGAGRLPAHYSAEVPGGEFAGQALWRHGPDGTAVVELSGPATRQDMAYDFGLTQRVDLWSEGNYRVRIRYQTDAPLVLLLSVCERHLLYDFRCQWKHVRPEAAVADPDQWHEMVLPGKAFAPAGRAVALRDGMFTMTVLSVGRTARIHEVALWDARGHQVLKNGDFARGLMHWFPAAQGSFKPWHIDNLYLEILIERGLLGWLVVALLAAWTGHGLARALQHREPWALALSGSLVSMGVLGLVISVTELPRVAFMLLLILLTTSRLRRSPQSLSCNGM
ncbi:O-antigen ligase family protein [Hydrogenophaga sp. BPS33]|uniref:O-antigen ligase family protein n=1 Tax=Hydrogenophaga sp. BPS33 TaxID=2651974 RepID=UPI00131FEA2E|nr:hypothetical protein [Hydrogenophaga sp. BPS33]QHE85943.1 hypothetical protein F9K07_14015 [Hydrogenophaga sp. BPS33]